MSNQPRVDFPGAFHHVMNRGARREPVFLHDEHCGLFLDIVARTAARYDLEFHAFSLMPNHYHLAVHSPHGTLSRGMQYLGSRYTKEVNALYRFDGPMFRGRFLNRVITSNEQLITVAAYIHLNPVRARLVRRPDQHCWTSHRAYLGIDPGPPWLRRARVLDLAGGTANFDRIVREYHCGAREWPPGEQLDPVGRTSVRAPVALHKASPRPAAKDILARVTEITGASPETVMTARKGRAANPARRFAVWAFRRDSGLSDGEIGVHFAMSANHVRMTEARSRKSAALQNWIERWEREE